MQIGNPYDMTESTLQFALDADDESFAQMWQLNMESAIADRCRNLRVCGALKEFPQVARDEIQKVGDRGAGMAAAKQAWKVWICQLRYRTRTLNFRVS